MTKKSRMPSAEERELFEETLKGAAPLAKTKPSASTASPVKRSVTTLAPPAISHPKKPQRRGLDGNTAERLARGQIEPEARLDLHGMTEAVAHLALATFIRSASARKLRLVLVVTGKGRKLSLDEPFDLELNVRARGVLRSMTPRWLSEPELARFVADVRPSNRRHGGDGALYVYLSKAR